MPQLDRTAYVYTPLFCEENIWQLVSALYTNQLAKPIDVLFILNQTKSIALFAQNQNNLNQPVIWDYHVILLAQLHSEFVIFDFDSDCEFPVPISTYFQKTFPVDITLPDIYQPYIKPVNAAYFLKYFYSDREHMKGIIKNEEFPQYEIIMPAKNIQRLTLEQCRNISPDTQAKKLHLPDDYLRLHSLI